jgi:signal peptidase II
MRRKYWVFSIVCFWVILADQWTKYLVQRKLPLYHKVEIIKGFFNLTHVRNTGGAFGIFSGERGGVGSLLFIAFSFTAIGIILFLFSKAKDQERHLCLSLALIFSGAVGNLIDRLVYGEVVDFLQFYVSSFYWPAFNIADSAICSGIGLMALDLLIRDRKGSLRS